MREARIILPTLHTGQAKIYRERARMNAVRCGRRWGKTKLLVTIAGNSSAKGRKVGIFGPEHKQISEPFSELKAALSPLLLRSSSTEGVIRCAGGGLIDFWNLKDNELAGRGREYDDVLIDEAAFTKSPQMLDIWRKSIRPTLLTRRGKVWVFSTPSGINPENFFWKVCNDPEFGFKEFHAPTSSNPMIPADELERERISNPPLVFKQEYLAEFVDWSGVQFFELEKMLVDGVAPEYPAKCDYVYAVIDTAVKDQKEHDGTAVVYCARTRFGDIPLMLVDYDITQIEGALLETWLPNVLARLDELAGLCGARQGSAGVFIEDKASGSILLQQAARRGWPAHSIESTLTSVGKEERAISVSGYVYRGMVKISRHMRDKLVTYKGQTRNHFESQFFGFRIGAKEGQADDLLDCGCYSIAIGLGDSEGH